MSDLRIGRGRFTPTEIIAPESGSFRGSWRKLRRARSVPSQIFFLENPMEPIGTALSRPELEFDAFEILARIPNDLVAEYLQDLAEGLEAAGREVPYFGNLPGEDEVRSAALARFRRRLDLRFEALRESIPMDEYALLTGHSREDLMAAARSGRIASIRLRKRRFFPRWQFTEDLQVRPGVAELIAAFPGGASALTTWMTEPNQVLGDRTPAEVFASGVEGQEQVLSIVSTRPGDL